MADPVTINRKLNLVVKVDSPRGTLHVISTPISRAVFEDNFLIMCRAYAEIYRHALGVVTGPKAAALFIRREAAALGEEAKGAMLIEEIHRLTNVLVPTTNGGGSGYNMVDYGVAVRQGTIDEDTAADIDAALCFFMLASRAGPQKQLEAILDGLSLFWNAETTSLTLTEYLHSLPTSTMAADTGPRVAEPELPMAMASPAVQIPQ